MVTHAHGEATVATSRPRFEFRSAGATNPGTGLVARALQAVADQRAEEGRRERQRLEVAREAATTLLRGALAERFGVDGVEVDVDDQPNASGHPVLTARAPVDELILGHTAAAGQVFRLSQMTTAYSEVDVYRPCASCGEPVFLGRAAGLLDLGRLLEDDDRGCFTCHDATRGA